MEMSRLPYKNRAWGCEMVITDEETIKLLRPMKCFYCYKHIRHAPVLQFQGFSCGYIEIHYMHIECADAFANRLKEMIKSGV